MRNFIITTIIALAAVKAKSQAKAQLDIQMISKKLESMKQFEETRKGAN